MFKPSPLQQAIYDWVGKATGSAIVVAVAGSGKTTTLVHAVRLMQGSKFFGAFNKDICVEIEERTKGTPDLTVSTFHAAGLRTWKTMARWVKVDASKVKKIATEEINRYMPDDIIWLDQIVTMVGLAKQGGFGFLVDEKNYMNWVDMIDHFDIETRAPGWPDDSQERIIEAAIWILGQSNKASKEVIDFNDMIYMPLLEGLRFPKYDWVLIDEAQDTNAVRREMALRMLADNGRLVAVGDPHQAIYGFTGADSDSLTQIKKATKAIELPLTVSYRCPKLVVNLAKTWVGHIEAAPNALDGVVRDAPIADLTSLAKVGDAVLCRFNKPLIKYVYAFIAKGIPARIQGREIGDGLARLATRWKVKDLNELLIKLDDHVEFEAKRLKDKGKESMIEPLIDKVECLRVIIGRCLDLGLVTKPPQQAVLDEIEKIFGNDEDQRPCVLFASGHRSKGREWKNVFWLTTVDSPFAKKAWQKEQEANLKYVISTRAMESLTRIEVPVEKSRYSKLIEEVK